MRSSSLLKQYVKLMVETVVGPQQQALQLAGPFKPVKPGRNEFAIYREFPIVPTPELMQALKLDESDLDEAGMITGENEIIIEFDDIYYSPGERGSWYQPADPEEFLVEDYSITAFNGLRLTPEDEKALKAYLGDLTDEEQERAFEYWSDNYPDPEPDDY